MPIVVKRPQLSLLERTGIPQILAGLAQTFRHLFLAKTTVPYPEQRIELPASYRGAPALVKDDEGREKCVACNLCEFICPPRAIRIVPAEIPADSPHADIERYPEEFEIHMLRCIFCGYCEEICPEEAIFMSDVTEITGTERADFLWDKAKLYEVGGTRRDAVKKWKHKRDRPAQREAAHEQDGPVMFQRLS